MKVRTSRTTALTGGTFSKTPIIWVLLLTHANIVLESSHQPAPVCIGVV